MDITNYIYFTIFFSYLSKAMSFSLTRSLDDGEGASLSEVAAFANFHVQGYDQEDPDSALYQIAQAVQARLPISLGAVTGVQALAFREGAVAPVKYSSERNMPGTVNIPLASCLPTFLTVSYSNRTFTFRRKGARFSLPVVDEAFSTGNELNAVFDSGRWGRGWTPEESGLLYNINTDTVWNAPTGQFSRKTVVKRVPNLAPEGSGIGDRLPSYITDPVSAVLTGDYDYNQRTRTQLGRKV